MKILITGASSGIGKDMAKTLGNKENELVLVARDEEKLKQVKEEIEKTGAKVTTISMDLSDAKNCIDLHNNVKNVDILINNARFWGLWKFYKNKFRQRINYDKHQYSCLSYIN